jgi:hypothetical protein
VGGHWTYFARVVSVLGPIMCCPATYGVARPDTRSRA